jgi:adenylate kinase
MKKIICLYGLPASGKTTQAEKLVKEFGYSFFGMGERLRAEINSESELGKKIKRYIDEGKLIPDEYMIQVIKNVGQEILEKGIVFDGFPRMISQAHILEDIVKELDMEISAFVCLNVSPEEALKRIKARAEISGRGDDKDAEAIKNRLDAFNKESIALLDYYRSKNHLIEIDGEMSIEEVYSTLRKNLEDLE